MTLDVGEGSQTVLCHLPSDMGWSLVTPSLYSDLCDLAMLKPLWQLFTHMEYSLFEDVTQPGILLPLHRALTELFFVTENRAQVRALPSLSPLGSGPGHSTSSSCFCSLCCPGQEGRPGSQPHPEPWGGCGGPVWPVV